MGSIQGNPRNRERFTRVGGGSVLQAALSFGGVATIRRLGERPAGVMEPGPVRPPGYVPRGLSAMIQPASGAAALGFVGATVVLFAGPGVRGSPADVVFLAVFMLAFAIPVVVIVRRARARGVAIVPLVAVLLLAGVAGAVVARAMPFGLR